MADASSNPTPMHDDDPSQAGAVNDAPVDAGGSVDSAAGVPEASSPIDAPFDAADAPEPQPEITAQTSPFAAEPLPAAAPLPARPPTSPFVEPVLDGTPGSLESKSLELLDDVELDVKVELGRTEMLIEDVLRLGVGSVVELDKLAGDPVDIYVNDRLVARGEVLVLNDTFCVRVNDLVSPIPEAETAR